MKNKLTAYTLIGIAIIVSIIIIKKESFQNKKIDSSNNSTTSSASPQIKSEKLIIAEKDSSHKQSGQAKVLNTDTVFVKSLGAVGDGITDDTKAIQSAINMKAKVLVFNKARYLVSKNLQLTNFPNDDQPCLLIINKTKYKVIGNNATLIVKQHGQGILEVQKSSKIIIEDLNLIGAGNFPKLDGRTGRGEKGIKNAGYYTSAFWGYYKNNSYNTENNNTGGFEKSFPQFSGGLGKTWGKWNGGFIGNVSYGLLIHNSCTDILIRSCKASKFNYVGIGVGHNGDYYPKKLSYFNSKNIEFKNCITFNNYSAGFHSMAVNGFKLTGGESNNNGHPDASANDDSCDPGYGYTARGSEIYTLNAVIQGLSLSGNKRKGLDAHAGENLSFINNKVFNSAICGIFAAWTNEKQKVIGLNISGNIIDKCGYGPDGLGGIYVGASVSSSKDYRTVNATIQDNIIKNYSSSGIRVRYANDAKVINNKLFNSIAGKASNLSSILILGKSEHDLSKNIMVIGNSINDQTSIITRGIQISNNENSSINNNQISFGKDINIGLYTKNSNNITINNNTINFKGKGTALATQSSIILKKDFNKTNGSEISNEITPKP